MKLSTLFAGFVACLLSDATATALTYQLSAHERACFYAQTKKEGEKVAFYFAVSIHPKDLFWGSAATMEEEYQLI